MKKHPALFICLILAATGVISSSVAGNAEAKSQSRATGISQRFQIGTSLQLGAESDSGTRRSMRARSRPAAITVQPGDSLFEIAAEVLGTRSGARLGDYVERIYKRNRTVIGADPNLIYPGQVLRLPAPYGIVQSSLSDPGDSFSDSSPDRTVRIGRGDTVWSIATAALDRVLTRSEARRVAPYVRLVPKPTRRLLVSLAARGAGARHPSRAISDYVERIARVNEDVIGRNPEDILPGQTIRLPKIENASVVPTQRAGQTSSERGVSFVDLVTRTAKLPKKATSMKPTSHHGGAECCPGDLAEQENSATGASSGLLSPSKAEDPSERSTRLRGYFLLVLAFLLLQLFWLLWRTNGRHSRRHRNRYRQPRVGSSPRKLLVASRHHESALLESSASTAREKETSHEHVF